MIMQKEKELSVQEKKISNIELRIISSIFIVSTFIISILWVPFLFNVVIILIAIGMLNEWYDITYSSMRDLLLGLIIIPIPIMSLLLINSFKDSNWLLLAYFITIWSVDSFAMIGGKKLKGPRLAPKLSPNKTWSGLIVGIVSSGCLCALISTFPMFNINHHFLFDKTNLIISCMAIAAIAQMSDLFISFFKRKYNLKDSGTIIPGHGGILDRFDSIILTAPLLFFAVNNL